MILECPHCQSKISLPPANAGKMTACPTCHQVFLVPAPVAIAAARPGMRHPTRSRPVRIRRKQEGGTGRFILVSLVLATAAFGVLMVRWGKSPQETWNHLSALAHNGFKEPATPAIHHAPAGDDLPALPRPQRPADLPPALIPVRQPSTGTAGSTGTHSGDTQETPFGTRISP